MKLTFYDILLWFQWSCMVASGLLSFKLIHNRMVPKYMNNFYWYSIVAGLAAIYNSLDLYYKLTSKPIYYIVNSISLLFHFLFLSFLIYRILPNRKYSIQILLLIITFLLLIFFNLFGNTLVAPPTISVTTTNFGLVLLCCIYYLQIFDTRHPFTLSKEPSFWIVTGIFVGMCATIPFVSLERFLFATIPLNQYRLIGGISAVGYGIMHLFFIKSYLCATSSKNNQSKYVTPPIKNILQ